MTAQALVLAKAGVSASGRDWMWSLFSSSWTGNGPAYGSPPSSRHPCLASLRCRAAYYNPTKLFSSSRVQGGLTCWMRFQQTSCCWAATPVRSAGRHCPSLRRLSRSIRRSCFAARHAFIRQSKVYIDRVIITQSLPRSQQHYIAFM